MLSTDDLPFDVRMMALISFGVIVIFFGLFLFGGASRILQSGAKQISYSPTLPNVAMLIVLVILSVLALSEYRATSKISWTESRGLPFSFVTFTEIRGVCSGGIEFWKCRSLESLNPAALIIDVLVVYSVICIIAEALSVSRNSDPKRWLLRKSGG